MEKVRTFIAIRLTPEIIAPIKKIQEKLKKSNARVRWVKPENIHLTLKFLGHITPEQLEKVKITAREALQPFKPFGISISGLGAFPKIKYPRVIWIGINKGKEELRKIAPSLEERLVRIGFIKDKREFSPHLTLGRINSSRGREELVEILTKVEASELGSMKVNRISIVKSELGPQGPTYTTLEEIELKA